MRCHLCRHIRSILYVPSATNEAGAVAALAEVRKKAKYANMDPSSAFQPVTVESCQLLKVLGQKVGNSSGEEKFYS